ncbi:MAG: hypothetical protein HN350_21200 [Phycisphaerales bacterium]|jgi:flagellar motor switch protein FliM|nr:hypothetical protein [Phycisphaerales bacterium]
MDQITQHGDDDNGERSTATWKALVGQLAGRFPTAMSQLLRGRGQLKGASVLKLTPKQFRDVLRALTYGRTYCWAPEPDRNDGCIWVGLDATSAAGMIDLMLGGRPYQSATGQRALTAIDKRLLGRITDRAAGLIAGLAGIDQPLQQRPDEQTPDLPEVSAVCMDLEIGGSIWLFACGELTGGSNGQAASSTSGFKGGPIELSATLNVAEISPDQLAELEIGDVISTDAAIDSEVVIRLAGIPKYIGQLSTVDGKKAVTIKRKITAQD